MKRGHDDVCEDHAGSAGGEKPAAALPATIQTRSVAGKSKNKATAKASKAKAKPKSVPSAVKSKARPKQSRASKKTKNSPLKLARKPTITRFLQKRNSAASSCSSPARSLSMRLSGPMDFSDSASKESGDLTKVGDLFMPELPHEKQPEPSLSKSAGAETVEVATPLQPGLRQQCPDDTGVLRVGLVESEPDVAQDVGNIISGPAEMAGSAQGQDSDFDGEVVEMVQELEQCISATSAASDLPAIVTKTVELVSEPALVTTTAPSESEPLAAPPESGTLVLVQSNDDKVQDSAVQCVTMAMHDLVVVSCKL